MNASGVGARWSSPCPKRAGCPPRSYGGRVLSPAEPATEPALRPFPPIRVTAPHAVTHPTIHRPCKNIYTDHYYSWPRCWVLDGDRGRRIKFPRNRFADHHLRTGAQPTIETRVRSLSPLQPHQDCMPPCGSAPAGRTGPLGLKAPQRPAPRLHAPAKTAERTKHRNSGRTLSNQITRFKNASKSTTEPTSRKPKSPPSKTPR